VAGVQQVHVKVKVAEVSRTALRTLGVNALYTGSDFVGGQFIGPEGGGPLNPVGIIPSDTIPISPGVTVFGAFLEQDFALFVQALAENQYLRILAEPDLVALSGEEASFLAGGEFPIPVVQGGIVGNTAITIEYKEFGVRLRFRPTVLGDGTIRMYVAPEVSELSDIGAVVIQGFRVPAISTRRAETTLELKSGQTFGMAGLLRETASGRSSRIPGFGDIPILGALFRSVRYSRGETELVVLVTASLVEPMSSEPPVPGQTHTEPNDWQFYGLGRLEGDPASLAPEYMQWLRDCGVANLKGPGGWAGYGDRPYPVRSGLSPAGSPPTTKPAGT
jgi:pilus assembly protein CpaC